MPLDQLTSASDLSTSLAWLAAFSLGLVLWLGFTLALAQAANRRARDAAAAAAGATELREGATLVTGVAEIDGSTVSVRLTEEGTEWKHKGSWHHKWTEVARDVQTGPFILRTDRGERVHVQPGPNVFLVDTMTLAARNTGNRRERIAELTNGERVSITGRLTRSGTGGAGPHRSSERQWIMLPPAIGPMILATESLADRHRGWARFHARAALAPLLILLAFQLWAYVSVYDFVLHGSSAVGEVRDHAHHTTHDRHGTHHHYEIDVGWSGRDEWFDVTYAGYERAPIGSEVALVVTPAGAARLGSEPGADLFMLSVPGMVILFAVLSIWLFARSRRAWWEQKRVITQGGGKLETH